MSFLQNLISPAFGEFALSLGVLLNLLIIVVSILHRNHAEHAVNIVQKMFYAQCACWVIALGVLLGGYINSDFSFLNVWENSALGKPLGYRIAATWGNHEGSFLLWLCFMSAQLCLFLKVSHSAPHQLRMLHIGIGAFLQLLFSIYIVAASSPFKEIFPVPPQGQDLNPVLQDVLLLIHPPLLYIGTSGTAVLFVIAIGFTLTKFPLRQFVLNIEKFALLAWGSLTIGIALGAYWAYYELGWGGWWFWDPVENSSFIPWLVLLALLHGLKIVRTRNNFQFGTVLLCLLPFMTVILGTFLVRSGVLNSVHAFAVDPTRGVWLLAILGIIIVLGMISMVMLQIDDTPAGYKILSREFALRLNVIFMATTATIVCSGVLYPLIIEAMDESKISVGQSFFESITFPFSIFMFALMVASPFLNWGGKAIEKQWHKLGAIVLVCAGLWILNLNNSAEYELIYSAFLMLGCGLLISPMFEGRVLLSKDFRVWGTRFAHLGVGLAILGALFASQNKLEVSKPLAVGESYKIAAYTIKLDHLTQETTNAYVALVAHLKITHDAGSSSTARTERRMYTIRNAQTTEVALSTQGLNQLYIALGEVVNEKQLIIRAQYKPKILLLWLGVAFMVIGGVLSSIKAWSKA